MKQKFTDLINPESSGYVMKGKRVKREVKKNAPTLNEILKKFLAKGSK